MPNQVYIRLVNPWKALAEVCKRQFVPEGSRNGTGAGYAQLPSQFGPLGRGIGEETLKVQRIYV